MKWRPVNLKRKKSVGKRPEGIKEGILAWFFKERGDYLMQSILEMKRMSSGYSLASLQFLLI